MRNEFDNYNTLKLEDRMLTASEIEGLSMEYLIHRIKKLVKRSAKKLKNIQISISERNALMAIAAAGLTAINAVAKNEAKIAQGKMKLPDIEKSRKASRAVIMSFFVDDYALAIANGSHRDLSSVSYFDYVVDPKDAVTIQRQTIDDNIKSNSSFDSDVPHREYGMSGLGEVLPVDPSFFSVNKEKLFIALGALALGALGYHLYRTNKR